MKKVKVNNIYFEKINFENINEMWKTVKKTCKNKKAVFYFNMHKNTNIISIVNTLNKGDYVPSKYRLFMIFEPKPRLVMSSSVYDKIVNHFVANYYLIPYLEKKLLNCNVATRKGMGSSYANKLVTNYINEIRIKYPNLNHEILVNMLKSDISDENVLNIIENIISETDKPYINENIIKFRNNYNIDIPLYKKGIGLSIGAMTSQFLAIYYLNNLDHYIKEKLKCKWYVRYMDDLLILDISKDKLKKYWKNIELELKKLKLEVNPKSNIINLNNGLIFIGYKYIIKNNRFKVTRPRKKVRKIVKKLYYLKKYDLLKYYRSYSSYYGYLNKITHCERKFTMSNLEKYNYYKLKYPNNIIFIKDKEKYILYSDNAKLISKLYNYKIINNKILLYKLNAFKLFDKLKIDNYDYNIV